jgi:hypothetical protein
LHHGGLPRDPEKSINDAVEGTQDIEATYIDLDDARGLNLLYHELGYAITFFD